MAGYLTDYNVVNEGSAEVNEYPVLVTSGSFAWGNSPVYQEVVATAYDKNQVSRFLHSDGQASASANISWDLASTDASLLATLVYAGKSGAKHYVKIHDGQKGKQSETAWLQTLSLSCASNALVTANASFLLTSDPDDWSGHGEEYELTPVPYYHTGSELVNDIRSWSININWDLQPKYYNDSTSNYPGDVKVGPCAVDVTIECYDDISSSFEDCEERALLDIGVADFYVYTSLNQSNWTFNGVEEPGVKSYTFNSCRLMTSGTYHYSGSAYDNGVFRFV